MSRRSRSDNEPVLGLFFSMFMFFIICGGIVYEVIGSAKNDPGCRHYQPLEITLVNATTSGFKPDAVSNANWYVELMFANPQPPYKVIVRPSSAVVYYKNPVNVVSCTSLEPMFIGPGSQRLEHLMFAANGCEGDQPIISGNVLADLVQDIQNDRIEFVLELTLSVKYWNKEWYFLYELNAECDGLAMVFDKGSGIGTMAGNVSTCVVRMPKSKSICM